MDDLVDEWSRLKEMPDAHARGHQFEAFVGTLFQREHFNVERKVEPANRRQVDLFASLGDRHFLVETKWWSRRINVSAVDEVTNRLRTAGSSVLGMLVSTSGFTSEAAAKVQAQSHTPILLLSGEEIDEIVRGGSTLRSMLERKQNRLTRHQRVLLNENPVVRIPVRPSASLPDSAYRMLASGGSQVEYLEMAGSFDALAFVMDLADIDWVLASGTGVTLDFDVPANSQTELIALLRTLGDLGWMTEKAAWRIGQSLVSWSGFGAAELVTQLETFEARYRGREMHHTEQLVYFDLCEGGFYSVTADISRHRFRQVNGCRISFQLEGIPLDLDPFRTLARSFDGDFAFFRPRSKRSVKKRPIAQLGAPIGAKALIVQEIGGHGSDHEDWVIGVVLDDPGDGLQSADRTKLGLPTQPLDRWICTLDSWHPISAPQKYKVRSIESAWTSDAVAIHARADWVDSVERALAKDVVPVFDD